MKKLPQKTLIKVYTIYQFSSLQLHNWGHTTSGHPKPTEFKDPGNLEFFEKSQKVLECECDRKFNSVEELDEHDCLQSTRIITCEKCEKTFRSETAYYYHHDATHSNIDSNAIPEILKGSLKYHKVFLLVHILQK